MTYTPQTWVDDDPTKPISAARMNFIEAGIASANTGLSATTYGAIGDGAANNDTALTNWVNAINAASAGSIAVLPAGQYLITAPLPAITQAGVKIFGAGHAQTAFTKGSVISVGASWSNTAAMVRLAGEGCELNGVMIDGQGTATTLITVSAANCRLLDIGTHGVAAGTGGVPNVCVDIVTGGVSCWITDSRINGINFPNTGIQVNDTDAIIATSKPTNNTYNIVLLSGASGTKIHGNHMTPGSNGASCIFYNGNPSHVDIIGNRFDNYVQSGIILVPPSSSPNSVNIIGNHFYSNVQTDNTYAAVALDTAASGIRAFQIVGNTVYGSATHRPKYFIAAMKQDGSTPTNTSRVASYGTVCNSNIAWAATSFYGSGSPSLANGNMTATDGQTYTVVPDISTIVPGQRNDVTLPPYNAVGDGVTDDTTAVQNAINAGGVTFFPQGKTFLCGKLTLQEGSVLQGVNSGYLDQTASHYSIIQLKAATNDHLINVPLGALGVQIYDLQLDGNKANQSSGTCNVINVPDAVAYEQTQLTVQRCFVKNGRSYGIYGGNERGGIKVLQTRAYNNSNSSDQLDGIRLMAADNMVAFCSAGLNGGNGVFIGSGPSFVFSNGIWGNLFRGITIASTITEVVIMMNGIDTNARQGLFISTNCDTITVVGNTFHTNSQAATNTYPHIEVASTKGTISLVGNQSGPLDGGSTGTPTQLIKLDASVSVFSHGNVASAGSTTNGVTDDWSHHLTGVNAYTGTDAGKPTALAVQPGSWALANNTDGGTLYVYDGASVTKAAPGKVHAAQHLTGGTDAITWGSVPLDSLGLPAGNINFNGHNAGSVAALVMSGLTGATSATRFVGGTASGAPTSGTFLLGDFIIDQTGDVWICVTAGTPGTWTSPSQSAELIPINIVTPIDPRVGASTAVTMAAINNARGVRAIARKAGTLTDLAVFPTTNSGNIDVGVFNAGGSTKLFSTGSTAMSGLTTNQWNIIASGSLATTVTKGQQIDFMVSMDNTTGAVAGYSPTGTGVAQIPANFWASASQQFLFWNATGAFPLTAGLTYSATSAGKYPIVMCRIV